MESDNKNDLLEIFDDKYKYHKRLAQKGYESLIPLTQKGYELPIDLAKKGYGLPIDLEPREIKALIPILNRI